MMHGKDICLRNTRGLHLKGESMGQNLISIIVPVYNVENYIKECIDSILLQTLRSFELILVDDGSEDNSGRICDEYKEKDSRIKVFHKKNGGLSSARNMGLDEASGDYICFVDSDDTIRADYLEKLYKSISLYGSDMAICDIETIKNIGDYSIENQAALMKTIDCRKWLYDDRCREYVLMVVACNKMYSSKIFNDIRYPEKRLHEDEFVIGAILCNCKDISFVSEKLYVYRDNESGITANPQKINIKHLDAIDALYERVAMAISDDDMEFATVTLKNALYKCARFYEDAKKNNALEMKNMSMEKYCEVFNKYKELLSLKQKLKYSSFKICPDLFVLLYNP